MPKYSLVAHSSAPPTTVSAVEVELIADPSFDEVLLRFTIVGGHNVVLPVLASPSRANELWKTTCFELFVRAGDDLPYIEFNGSPSGQWSAYAFDDYRHARRDLQVAVPPHIERVEEDGKTLIYDVEIDLSEVPQGNLRVGLSAIIEETDGTKSFWALRHPPGPPDFHHPDCFALELAAPDFT